MPLTTGARLGPYEIVAMLGAGGMGEVYKARDTRLDRTVALKVLPEAIARDPQFRERFEREARVISQLTHPHICALYDVGDGFLVMEYLEGETLAARLERGPLKLDDALKTAGEIGSALDQAHRAGIVHRDLKPANVMLTRAGVKLLDFGLAKQATPAVAGGGTLPAAASAAITAQGVILGTFQYMAPEQLEGAEPDARVDIFAFGAILYEMVTGRKAFEGKTQVSLISAILKDEPPPISTVVPVAPKALDRIIHACLAKDPDARLRSTHDLVLQLQWLAEGPHADVPVAAPPVVRPQRKSRPSTAWAVAGVLGLAALVGGFFSVRGLREAPAAADAIQFTIPAPENSVFGGQVPTFAISPDGRQLAFVANNAAAVPMLFVRPLAALTMRPLPGTEQATYPFWSPDSRSLAFFASGKLKRVQIAGGAPTVVSDAASARGGTWNADNVMLFAPTTSGPLQRVGAAGGTPSPATTVDSSRGETAHRWPSFLPDGRHFLYVAVTTGQQPSSVRIGSLDSQESVTIVTSNSMAVYASGHLFFWRDGGMMAQAFDPQTRQLSAESFSVATPVGELVGIGYVSFSVSQTGVFVYARGSGRAPSQLTWRDRSGKQLGTVGAPGDYFNVALSPDERRVGVTLLTGPPENRDIWLIDLARSMSSRLTSDPANDVLPVWSPDGARLLFGSNRPGASGVYVKNADGSGAEELLMKTDENTSNAMDWSRDGRYILYYSQSPQTGYDLWVLPLDGDRKPMPVVQTRFTEDHPAFASDGRWMAYSSNESGREEVYVQPFPATGAKHQVSRSGGTQPLWRGDGRELFFLAADGTMMAASIRSTIGLEAGIPLALFPSGVAFSANRRQYAVTRDGQRFLVLSPQERSAPTPLTVVVNWQAAIQR